LILLTETSKKLEQKKILGVKFVTNY
jgi:hypothetical protein